jgi:K+-sensing histidine kinase KdpD
VPYHFFLGGIADVGIELVVVADLETPVPGEGQRLDEINALYRIATLSTFRGDTDVIIKEILRVVTELVPCDTPALFLHDEEFDEMRMYRTEGPVLALPSTECGICRRVFMSRTAEHSNDIARDPDGGEVLQQLGARQVVAAPLSAGEDALGVLVAVNSLQGAFNDDDVRMVSILADRAALTIENSQLLAKLERQVQELVGLQKLSKLLTTSDSMEQVVSESIRIVMDSLDCEKGLVLLYEEEDDSLVAHAPVPGLSDEQVAALRVSMTEPSLAGTAFRTNAAVTSNRAENDGWVNPGLRNLLGMKSVISVPLASGPRPIGVLEAINAKQGFFSESDQRFLGLLGSQVGSMIEAMRSRGRERGLLAELRELDRTRTEFISMLAHELRGPMTTIMGFGYTLRDQFDKLDEEKRTRVIGTIVKEVERLSRMVNDLLDLSRMEAGTLRYELAPLELKEFVDSLISTHTSLQAKHIVSDDVPEEIPRVLADRDRLDQVMINLLTNATRYSPEGTAIRVNAEAEDSQVVVSVSDEGIGIPEGDADRIFEKFSMLPKPAWVKKGTGLGLFITRGILEAMNGRIWVESESGKGSTFYFSLPRAD